MSERTTEAKKGESLYSIAKRTVPAGKSVDSWFQAIKKMNTKNGKVRRVFVGTGVGLPPGARNASAANRAGAWSTTTKKSMNRSGSLPMSERAANYSNKK